MVKPQVALKLPIHITVDFVPAGIEKETIIDQMRAMSRMLGRGIDLHIVGKPPKIILLGANAEAESGHA